MDSLKNLIKILSSILLSLLLGIIICETILRIKHKFIVNYDIEMWKYAKKLKVKDTNLKIGHTHIKNKSAKLQNVKIKINNHGQRDVFINNEILKKYEKRFLIIGSSVALGWGVDEKNIFSNVLNNLSQVDKKNWIFINGGVGNYNTERYVNNYLQNWQNLNFTDIIVHFFVNDTEVIEESNTNFFTKNTHLGVVVWKLLNSYKSKFSNQKLDEYYKKRYENNYQGFKVTQKELKRLKDHCLTNNINCHIVLMPDIHQLNPYKLSFINEKIFNLSKQLELPFLDLLDTFKNIDANRIWNKYQDPHPNDYGHKIMGKAIYQFLSR